MTPIVAASSAPAAQPQGDGNLPQKTFRLFIAARDSIASQVANLEGLWDKFIPMSILFFLMAFINTIIDSLKDSLVITAVGGGTEVLPYLSCTLLLIIIIIILYIK